MTSEKDEYLNCHSSPNTLALNKKIDEIIALVAPTGAKDHRIYKELFQTVLRMMQADHNYWDAKLAKNALNEMEKGFSLVERFKGRRKVTVFGSARTPTDHPLYQQAKALGACLAKHNFMVITGAGGGIMAAAHEGAGTDNSLGFNIKLPFEQYANETMEGSDVLLTFQYFFIRKLFFVKEAAAVVLYPGGLGTLDESFEVLTLMQTGKTPLVPIIMLETPDSNYWKEALNYLNKQLKDHHYILPSDMQLITLVHTPEEATQEIITFYSNYHSSRWFKETFAIRMNLPLNEQAMKYINEQYNDLCLEGNFTQQAYQDHFKEAEFNHLTYLHFSFTGKQYGRVRQLINYINLSENWINH